jgi:hypothetical protein
MIVLLDGRRPGGERRTPGRAGNVNGIAKVRLVL